MNEGKNKSGTTTAYAGSFQQGMRERNGARSIESEATGVL